MVDMRLNYYTLEDRSALLAVSSEVKMASRWIQITKEEYDELKKALT